MVFTTRAYFILLVIPIMTSRLGIHFIYAAVLPKNRLETQHDQYYDDENNKSTNEKKSTNIHTNKLPEIEWLDN